MEVDVRMLNGSDYQETQLTALLRGGTSQTETMQSHEDSGFWCLNVCVFAFFIYVFFYLFVFLCVLSPIDFILKHLLPYPLFSVYLSSLTGGA